MGVAEMKRRSFVRLLKRFKATWRFRAGASLTRSRAWCCSSPPTRPASRPAPSSSLTAAFCSAQCRTPARKGQMADHEVLIQQLNRHHATKQFDLLRKIAKEGKSYEPFQQPDSNREPKPRLQSVPNGFSDVQIFEPRTIVHFKPHPTLAMNQLPNSRVIWHERCVKDSEFESASKQMNTSQKRIPIFEFGEVKLEPAILRSKTSLKP